MTRPLDALLEANRPRGRGAARLAMALLAAALVWSAIARLDEVVVAPGLLVAEGRAATARHPGRGVAAGAPVGSGPAVPESVPPVGPLIVELRLPYAARDRVRVGQAAMVRVAGSPGGIPGKVERIASSAVAGPGGQPYVPVLVRLGQGSFPLTPGVAAIIDLKTGERTVLDHLLEPMLKLRGEAFRGP